VFITIVPGFVLGSFLTFAPEAWYETYNTTTLAYGVSALEDQQIGGLIMWIPGSFVIATVLLLTLRSAVRAETNQQLQKEAVDK
jgi:putative membrane protein